MSSRRARLAEARRLAGYSQEALASRLGIDRSTVQRWESGESSPQPAQHANLATVLEMTPGQLTEVLVPEMAVGSAVSVMPSTPANLPTLPVVDAAPRVGLLGLLDAARPLVDATLAATTLSREGLALIEERVAEHLTVYTRTPPADMLGALTPDIVEVQTVASARQPAVVQARLSEAMAVLALLAADALMKLGEIRRARYWYGTARLASDDTDNFFLRARVRAQEAMLPYYYGDVGQAVALARSAQELLSRAPSEVTALAAAAEGRALARLGDRRGAEHAMETAQRLVDEAGSRDLPDAAFHFNHKRLLLYLSGTLTNLGEAARAQRIQREALDLHNADPTLVIDPALIRLDEAIVLANQGHIDDSCQLATHVITGLPEEHRGRVVLTRADEVLRALPEGHQQRPQVAELGELIGPLDGAIR